MNQSVLDTCMFYKRENGELVGVVGTLVDCTLGFSNNDFTALEQDKSSRFDVKRREESLPMNFNG